MEKQKYFGDSDNYNQANQNLKGLNTANNNPNFQRGFDINIKNYTHSTFPTQESNNNALLDNYKEFFEVLKEDLKKMMDLNISISREIDDVEEERHYYLDKLKNVLKFCDKNENTIKLTEESEKLLQNIEAIIKHQPEDFK